MNQVKWDMIRKAQTQYSTILPCTSRNRLEDCFTSEGSRVIFWFNTEDNNTHILISDTVGQAE